MVESRHFDFWQM